MEHMYVGSHVSIRHGYFFAAKAAFEQGANAFQYFPKNPRQLAVKCFNKADALACSQFCAEQQIKSIAHSPYPVNLASPRSKQLMIDSLKNDLEIVEACGSIGLVVHFGWYKGADVLQAYETIIHSLNDVLSDWDGEALILIENQAGNRALMGMTLEELVRIRSLSDTPEKIGFCLDTCHAFASGLLTHDNIEQFVEQAHITGFVDALQGIHLNDSLYETRSFRDRHANIGQGKMGNDWFKAFLSTSLIKGVPLILETEKGADGTHRLEIEHVKKLAR